MAYMADNISNMTKGLDWIASMAILGDPAEHIGHSTGLFCGDLFMKSCKRCGWDGWVIPLGPLKLIEHLCANEYFIHQLEENSKSEEQQP